MFHHHSIFEGVGHNQPSSAIMVSEAELLKVASWCVYHFSLTLVFYDINEGQPLDVMDDSLSYSYMVG